MKLDLDTRRLFNRTVGVVYGALLLFLTIAIAVGTVRLFLRLGALFVGSGVTGHYLGAISDVLTLFVLVELSRSLVEYFGSHRLRLTFITDAAIVFVLRELMIGLFKHRLAPADLYALAVLIFVLGLLRIGSSVVNQRERELAAAHRPARDGG